METENDPQERQKKRKKYEFEIVRDEFCKDSKHQNDILIGKIKTEIRIPASGLSGYLLCAFEKLTESKFFTLLEPKTPFDAVEKFLQVSGKVTVHHNETGEEGNISFEDLLAYLKEEDDPYRYYCFSESSELHNEEDEITLDDFVEDCLKTITPKRVLFGPN